MRILIFTLLILGLFSSPVVFVLASTEPAASVAKARTATPADAKRAKDMYIKFRNLTETAGGNRAFTASEQDLNSVLIFASRAVPRARAQAEVVPYGVIIDGSIQLPNGEWLNGKAEFAPVEDGIAISYLRIGETEFPAALAIPLIETVLNLALGDKLGSVAVNSVRNTHITGKTITTDVVLTKENRRAFAKSSKDAVRVASGLSSAEDVRDYWLALYNAAQSGTLDRHGSFSHFLHFATERAIRSASPGREKYEMQTAIFALAILCGHVKLQAIIGDVIPKDHTRKKSVCDQVTLAGRRDLRAHFAVSAGLQIASDAGFAFAVGEYKELLDANRGGSGFSFDDIAADRVGIEFAQLFSATTPSKWPDIVRHLTEERNVFPRIDDLPSLMPQEEFNRRFGSVDSPAYAEMLAFIDKRIRDLPAFSNH